MFYFSLPKERKTIYFRALFIAFVFALLVFTPFQETRLGTAARAQTGQAIIRLSPQTGSFLMGSTFDLSIVVDTKGVAVNTVEVELLFPPDKMQIASPSVGKSIIQIWPAPPVFSNREGRIYFVGGIPSPGIVTSDGVVLTLTFRVTAPGEAEVKFGDRVRLLANDGKGTNILVQKPSAFFKFSVPPPQGPQISSPTHPDQEKWYRDPNPIFVWPRSPFGEAYSFSIDENPSGFPDTTADSDNPTASFQNLTSGIWYFHLRERAGGQWGGVSHYVVKIDTEPPAAFKIAISPGTRTTNRNPIFRFFTTDALSGLSHYEIKLVPLSAKPLGYEALFFEINSPYQAANLEPGRYQVIVRAIDRAGNTRDEALTLHILDTLTKFLNPEGIDLIIFFIPWWILALVLAILAAMFIAIVIAIWFRHRHHIHHAFKEDLEKLLHPFRRKLPQP